MSDQHMDAGVASTSNAHDNSGSANNSRSLSNNNGDAKLKSFRSHLARQGKLDKQNNSISNSIVMQAASETENNTDS